MELRAPEVVFKNGSCYPTMEVVMFRHIVVVLLSIASIGLPLKIASASTVFGNFIQQRALDPIKLQTGLPEAASRLFTPSELQLSAVHNNVFMGGLTDSERLVLDGESSQLNLRYRRRISACWQLNLSGSWLSHSSGWFDQPVHQWHQIFGLPDAQRGDWPSNQLEYLYENAEQQQVLPGESYGWGDAQVQVQHYLGCAANAPIVRAGIKLPVGDREQFLGNGSLDAFVDIQSTWNKLKPASRWQWAASFGVLKAGNNEFIAEQESLVGFGIAGLNYSLNTKTELLGQLDWHTPMFKSELRELGKPAAQLSLGMRYQTRSRGSWEVSFSEDVAVDTSPDIVVRLAWISRFDAVSLLK